MGENDLAFKRLAALRPGDLARLLLGGDVRKVKPVPTDLPAQRREPDWAARITRGRESFILHAECQRDDDADVDLRMLGYHVGFHLRERAPVRSVLLALEGEGAARQRRTYRVRVGGREEIAFRYDVLVLAQLPAGKLLDARHPLLLALVPLARGGGERATLAEAVRRIRRAKLGPSARADLLTALAVFAGVRDRRGLVGSLVRMAEMKKSVIYQEIFAAGRTKGLEQGLNKGLNKGLVQGQQKGQAEAVAGVLAVRFAQVPDAVRERVMKVTDPERLRSLLAAAIRCASLDEFERELGA